MLYANKDIVMKGYHSVPKPITKEMLNLLDSRGFFAPPSDSTTLQQYIETHQVVDVYCQSLCLVNEVHNRFMLSLYRLIPDMKLRSLFIKDYLIYAFCPIRFIRDILAKTFYNANTLCDFYDYNISDGTGSDKKEVEELMNKVTFNCAMGNPPYNNNLYLKFIRASNKMASDYSLWITPSEWNMGNDSDFDEEVGVYMTEIKFIDEISNVFKDMDLQGRLVCYICEKKEDDI